MSSDTQDQGAKLVKRLSELSIIVAESVDFEVFCPDLDVRLVDAADRITTLLSDLAQAREVIAKVRNLGARARLHDFSIYPYELLDLLPVEPGDA